MANKLNINQWVARSDKIFRAMAKKLNDLDRKQGALAQHVDAYEQWALKSVVRPESAVPALVRSTEDNRLYVNKLKDYVKPIVLRTDKQALTVTVSANRTASVSFVLPPEDNAVGDVEITSMYMVSRTSPAARVMLYHTGAQKYLMNKPVQIGAVFADMDPSVAVNAQPVDLYESIYLEPNQEIRCDITDYSGADNTFELVIEGRRFWAFDIEGLTRESLVDMFYSRLSFPFWFTLDSVTTLATSTTAGATTAYATCDRSFDLELVDRCRYESTGTVVTPYSGYHVEVRESYSSRVIMDNVSARVFGGSGQYPLRFKEPWLVKRGSPIYHSFTNNDGQSRTVDLVYRGRALPYSLPGQKTLTPTDPNLPQAPYPTSAQDLAVARRISV